MSFLSGIGNIVSKVLPKVVSTVENIAASPAGKIGIDILKQLAGSAFSKDGKGGLFSDSFKLSLPNPLKSLNGLLGDWGKKVDSVGDFLSRIGDFLQGNRQLENGTQVKVPPRIGDRAGTVAEAASAISSAISSGTIHAAVPVNPGTVEATHAPSTTGTARAGGSVLDRIDDKAFTSGLSTQQNKILDDLKKGGADDTALAQMKAQMQMQNLQNLMQFMSNIARIMGDIQKGIIQNIR